MTTTTTPTLGAALRAVRHATGRSLRDLADQLGVAYTHLGNVERDRYRYAPSPKLLDGYAALVPDDDGATRDQLYHLAGRLPPEILAYLLADPGHVADLRSDRGIPHPPVPT